MIYQTGHFLMKCWPSTKTTWR